jgi:hypothetical protein
MRSVRHCARDAVYATAEGGLPRTEVLWVTSAQVKTPTSAHQ